MPKKLNFKPKGNLKKLYNITSEDEYTNQKLEKLLKIKFNDPSNMTRAEFRKVIKGLQKTDVQAKIIKVFDKRVPKSLLKQYRVIVGNINDDIIEEGIRMYLHESYNKMSIFNFDIKFLYDANGKDWSALTDTSPRELILENIYLLYTGKKKVEKDFFGFFPIRIMRLRLTPKIILMDKNNDYEEIYRDVYNKIPTKYKGVVTKYIEYFGKLFFDEALGGDDVTFYLQYEDDRARFGISNKYNEEDFKLTMIDYKFEKGKMIYDIPLHGKQAKYFAYYEYAIVQALDLGADGWGEGDIVTLDTHKAKKLKLGKLANNIFIDIYPVFDSIRLL